MRHLLTLFLLSSVIWTIAQSNCPTKIYPNGYATYYNLLENGSSKVVKCSYDAVNDIKGTKYGALNTSMYSKVPAAYCGMCVEMTGAAGTDTVQIVDECPTCTKSTEDIDLSPSAFKAIVGDLSIGVAKITWREVSCPWSKPIHIIVQGSNQWYAKVIIGHHVNRIKNVEVKQNGTWQKLTRKTDNGWVSTGVSINEKMKSFRITDIYDEQIVVNNIDFTNDPTNSKTNGTTNFTRCNVTNTYETFTIDNKAVAFPNPAKNTITFDGLKEVQEIEIININGVVVTSKEIGKNVTTTSFETDELEAGIYTAQIIGVQHSYRIKFVKE